MMRYVCPENGHPTKCKDCGRAGPHVREEWVRTGATVPTCLTHGVQLVLAKTTDPT